MTPFNISVVKPEDEPLIYNALGLQAADAAYGHHSSTLPYPETFVPSSGRSAHMYPQFFATTGSDNNNPYGSRPDLTHLETGTSHSWTDLRDSNVSQMDNTGRHYWQPTAPQRSPVPYGWTYLDGSTNSPSHGVNGSPLSQGYSPLTPNTPLSTVEPSPTASSLPSPGSQGSSEIVHLASSPAYHPAALTPTPDVSPTFDQQQLTNLGYHYVHSDTGLPGSFPATQTPFPAYSEYSDAMQVPNHSTALVRRHSYSTLNRAQQYNSQSTRPAPYPTLTALPARAPGNRQANVPEVPLVPRAEYQFQEYYLPGPIIPQTQYMPHSASDRRRYVDDYTLQEPILFLRAEETRIGITLPECATQRFKLLVGHNDELFKELGPSISIRLNWEGYESWSRQIPTRNFKVPPGPITRKHLAKHVAKTVQRFIDEHIGREMQSSADMRWRVGPGHIEFHDLVLLSLHHVSRGSWQANLCLDKPLEHILNRV